MGPRRKNENLKLKSIWDEKLLYEYLNENGTAKRHTHKLWNWMLSHPEASLDEVPMETWSIPISAVEAIRRDFVKFTSKIVEKSDSARGDTTKLLIELQDGEYRIETVVMRHRGHATVCVSSQIGCQMGCKFCATGTMGIIGNLTSGKILEQLIYANSITRIRNVVFMGMGEPLNNFENVKLAVEFMTDNKRFGLSPKHVTVSTVGVIKNMYRLTNEMPYVNLALSLHAPNQEIRLKIVPTASASDINKLMEAIDYHIRFNNRPNKKVLLKTTSVMIEYILIKGINDAPEHAHELGALLSSRRASIILNLIPYNPTDVIHKYEPPTPENISTFFEICISDQYRIYTRVRQEMGQDIAGACGQLALIRNSEKLNNENNNNNKLSNVSLLSDIEDYNNVSNNNKYPLNSGKKKEVSIRLNNQSTTTTRILELMNCVRYWSSDFVMKPMWKQHIITPSSAFFFFGMMSAFAAGFYGSSLYIKHKK